MSRYAAWVGEKMEKVDAGRPLGERLTWWPVRGAVAVKKRGWARAWMREKGLEEGRKGGEGGGRVGLGE